MLANTWLLAVIKCLAVCVLSACVVASASSSWALSQASQSLLGGPVPPGVLGYLIVLQPQISDGFRRRSDFVGYLAFSCEDGSNTSFQLSTSSAAVQPPSCVLNKVNRLSLFCHILPPPYCPLTRFFSAYPPNPSPIPKVKDSTWQCKTHHGG